MNRSSNKYCLLKKSFNCALKTKRIPIPFVIGKDSQTNFQTATHLERSSIPPYVTRQKPYQSFPLNGDNFFRTPILKDQKVALTIPFLLGNNFSTPPLFENNLWRIRANALQPLTHANHANPMQTPCMGLQVGGMRLPLQCAKLNTCSLQLNSLAQPDKLDYSCWSTNITKKDCMIVRPLLDLSRGLITAICKYGRFPVYPDRSNQSLHYSRNRIRKQILPSIQLFFNPQAEDALFKFTELVLQDQDLVSRVIHTTKRYRV